MDFQDLPLFRVTDPDTSRKGAQDIRPKQGSQMFLLLQAYRVSHTGLTDEQAGDRSGLAQKGAGYWKRCSDLRRLGLIEDSGFRRDGTSGSLMMVCNITATGLESIK